MPRPERPVDPAEGAPQRFAYELRELRRQAGTRTYRELAERSGYAVSTLSDAAGGRRLPTLEVALAYAEACGGDREEWEAKWHAAALAGTEREAEARAAHGTGAGTRPPYRGLSSFRAEDADLFFGRERLVAEVAERVAKHRVTIVLGASGVGKSSLLAAGLLPALPDRLGAGGREVRTLIVSPGEHPWDALLYGLGSADGRAGEAGEAGVRAAVEGLPDGTETVIVVDQFEELFTLCAEEVRTAFVDGLLGLAGRCRIVLGVRADFYGRCAEHPGLADALRENQVLAGPMSADELQEAVARPAAVVGLSVERALLATVAAEAKGQAGVLPLLSHALLETWRLRRGDVLTLAAYEAAGGIGGALVQTAEATYAGLDTGQRRLAAELLLRLLAVEEEAAPTRRRGDLAELLDVDPDAEVVIDRLAQARLVTVGEESVEIAHEALLTAWPRLRGWVDDDREAIRDHRKITEAARIWTESGRDPSTLATGARLEGMRARAASASGALRLSPVEREFIAESTASALRAGEAARRRTRRLRRLTAIATASAVVAALLAVIAGTSRTTAVRARDQALSRQLALTAGDLRETDPTLAAQLSIAGYRVAPTTEARSALIASSTRPGPARYLGGAGPTALAVSDTGSDGGGGPVAVSNAVDGTVRLFGRSGRRLVRTGVIPAAGRGSQVYALTYAPGGEILAVGDNRAAITLWDVSRPGSPRRLAAPAQGPRVAIERLDITPDGSELAAAGGHAVSRWDITDPTAPRPLEPLPSRTRTATVRYSPDGERLAFGARAGEAELWDMSGGTPKRLAELTSGEQPVPAIAFAPDGRSLVTGSHDGRLRRWDITSPDEPSSRPLGEAFDLRITTAAFSPDGEHLLAGSSDSTVRVLDASDGSVVRTLPHPDVVTWAAFDEGGDAILSVATDGTLRRWDLPESPSPRMPSTIFSAAFTRDGRWLAAFSPDGATVWDVTRPSGPRPVTREVGAPDADAKPTGAGDMSADGRLLASGTRGGGVEFFDISDLSRPRRLGRLGGALQPINAVSFSPDGRLLAAAGRDMAVRIWDVSSPGSPRLVTTIREARDVMLGLDWSPDGRMLAAASADSDVYMYDVTASGEARRRARLGGLDSYVYAVSFSPDGKTLAVGGVDHVVVLWDLSDPSAPRRIGAPITGPAGRIYTVAFHPAKELIAATVIDGTVWLWDIADPARPERVAVLAASDVSQIAAAFRPGDDLLMTGGADAELRGWRTGEESIVAGICAGAGDPITRREWSTYLHDLPYAPPCRTDGRPA